MTKPTVFSVTVDAAIEQQFLAAARNTQLSPAEIIRELIHDYVERQGHADGYDKFLEGKVARSRASLAAGEGTDGDEVEALFERLIREAKIAG